MMIRAFWHNMTNAQKTVFIAILQVLIMILLTFVVHTFTIGRKNVIIAEDDASSTAIPEEVEDAISDILWNTIKKNVQGVDQNVINDAKIREGTFSKKENEDEISVRFVLDIDSIEQTYVVATGWTKDLSVIRDVTINCPPVSEMKYPDTVCRGMYNNTESLDLYLPYIVKSKVEGGGADIYIDGNEFNRTIDVYLSTCDTDTLHKQAEAYLDSIPTDLSDYSINYKVDNTDALCET